MDAHVGTKIAGYRIESVLARGGMGVVYIAEQASPRRKVALKLLAPELASDPGFRQRFIHESEAAASTEHPNIVPIYSSGESDGQLYIAMRYVEGTGPPCADRRRGARCPWSGSPGSCPRSRPPSMPRTPGAWCTGT